MNKANLRAFAMEARQLLLTAVRRQAEKLGPLPEELLEEAAYTWFSRSIALRYMEVNGYLSCGAFTDEKSLFAGFRNLEAWGFEAIPDSIARLYPDDLDPFLQSMLTQIPREDWLCQVQILGWLYQYYFSQRHEKVVDVLRGKAIQKADIPAATQVFTPDWVVRYLVDNSLGRYWLQRNNSSSLAGKLEFLVTDQLTPVSQEIPPEKLTFFDPCMGTGHILVYAFDVLMDIYRERGCQDSEAARRILKYNLFGLDIDDRAAQLARFSLLMKARYYDEDILSSGGHLHLLAMREGTDAGNPLHERFRDAKELGSLISVEPRELSLWKKSPGKEDTPLLAQAQILAGKYRIVCTNPPYMSKIGGRLKQYLNLYFKPYSADLFSVFLYRNFAFCAKDGYCAYMTPNVWMFIKAYEPLRRFILSKKHITTLIQMAKGAFFQEASVDICAFVLENRPGSSPGSYFRLEEFRGSMELQKQKVLEALKDRSCSYYFQADQHLFSRLPGSPIAYWLSPAFADTFTSGVSLDSLAQPRQGLATADNRRFLRQWFEVNLDRICFDCTGINDPLAQQYKWFPYNKGGHFRKWYGNQDYIVNWEHDGYEIKHIFDDSGKLRSRPQNTNCYFRECFSWSLVSSGDAAFRYKPTGQIFDIAGMSCFCDDHLYYLLALCNSRYAKEVLEVIAPTINYQCGDIAAIPVILDTQKEAEINALVEENIRLSREDWDSFEISWDFSRHPLV